MTRATTLLLGTTILAGLGVGCATVPKDAGFADVQTTVHQRTGFVPDWVLNPDQEKAVKTRTRALLEHDLGVEEVVELALLNNHRVQATFEELGLARSDLLQARLPRNPMLGIDIRSPEQAFELSLMQSLISLLQIPRRRAVAAANFESTKWRVAHEVLGLVAGVRIAYYSLQAAEQVEAMRRTVTETARTSAELAIRQRDAGNLPDLGLENEQAFLEQAKLQLASSEAVTLSARENLNRVMGLWGEETNWKIAPALSEIPTGDPGLEGLESQAVAQRLDLQAAWQEIQAAARAVPLARRSANGAIELGVHREREPEGITTTGPVLDYTVPVFDQGKPAKSRAEALLRQSKDRYAALAVEIRSDIREAWNRLVLARSRVEYYRDVVLPRRSRIVELSQRNYNFMLLGPYQLILAKQNEINAQSESIQAQKDYWIARTELERAIGGSPPATDGGTGSPQPGEPTKENIQAPEPHHDTHGDEP